MLKIRFGKVDSPFEELTKNIKSSGKRLDAILQ